MTTAGGMNGKLTEFLRPGSSCNRVLVAEDDAMFRRILQSWLENWGYVVTIAEDGARAWDILKQEPPPQLLILDWMMPAINGLELCRKVRECNQTPYQYILLATAKDAKQDLVRGLEAGADDYLTKPFDFDELLARMEALVRRSHNFTPSSNILQVADLVLDRELLEVRRGVDTIKLTAKELAILELLMSAPGRVFSRTRILNQVWGYSEDPLTNVVDVYIARLRRKIDTPGRDPLLETVRGHGYRLKAPS